MDFANIIDGCCKTRSGSSGQSGANLRMCLLVGSLRASERRSACAAVQLIHRTREPVCRLMVLAALGRRVVAMSCCCCCWRLPGCWLVCLPEFTCNVDHSPANPASASKKSHSRDRVGTGPSVGRSSAIQLWPGRSRAHSSTIVWAPNSASSLLLPPLNKALAPQTAAPSDGPSYSVRAQLVQAARRSGLRSPNFEQPA